METNRMRQYTITEEEVKRLLIEDATIKHMPTLITQAVQEGFKPFHEELKEVKRRTNLALYLVTILATLYFISLGVLLYQQSSKELPVMVTEKTRY